MLTVICLTKSYRLEDFAAWFDYHKSLGCSLCILDNDSKADICSYVSEHNGDGIFYKHISGFPDQWKLFGDILNGKTELEFKDDELVMFLDDDEYLWFDGSKYSSLECALRAHFKQLSCLLLPEILLSTHHLTAGRSQILPLARYYHRNDLATQGKACIWWQHWDKYSYNHENFEIGHVPWINKIRLSDVVGSDVSKTTYGLCKYDAPLRLYHYHIKSEEDWKIKIERGSAAMPAEPGKNGSYDSDILKDKKYGGYDIPDFTMKYEMEKFLKIS